MWKSIKPTLVELATSKKALALLTGAIIWLLAQLKIVATPDQILPLLALIASYIAGQGLADFRKVGDKAMADSLGKLSPPSED